MKKGILNYFVIAVFALSAAFTSCDKNNDDDNKGNSDIALVSRILLYGEIPYDFTYDAQNRLSSIDFGYTVVPITYPSANTMVAIFLEKEFVFTLNNDGNIVKMRDPDGYEYLYEYKNGYLVKATEGSWETNWIWENENLISVPWEGGGETYTYSTILSKETNIAPWTTPMLLICGHGDAFYTFFPAIYFGKSSKYLVSSAIRDDDQREYRYETNADGYVTKVYEPRVDDDGNTWENLLYEIQYK